jgi:RNA 3'-terminal phosphate cyclase (ATP)
MASVEIDGSIGEGGGQVLRASIAYAAVCGKTLRISNIRAKRDNPGLRPQHLIAVKTVSTLCDGRVNGLEVGSREITLIPSEIKGGKINFSIGTAGSTTLVLQALIPVALFANEEVFVTLEGGTNNKWAPQIDYLKNIFLPLIERTGAKIEVEIKQRGHYPKGGGKITAKISPVKSLNPITLTEFGEVEKIEGLSHCVKLPQHVAERQANAAIEELWSQYGEININYEWWEKQTDPHLGPGSGIVLWAKTTKGAILGGDALGAPRKPAEEVGKEAAQNLLKELKPKMPVDSHTGDQLIPIIALAKGISTIKVSQLTLHTETCIKVSEIIMGAKFNVKGELNQPAEITCQGIGLENPLIED